MNAATCATVAVDGLAGPGAGQNEVQPIMVLIPQSRGALARSGGGTTLSVIRGGPKNSCHHATADLRGR